MARLLTTASALQCPHGGSVQAITSNSRVQAGGALAVRGTDTFMIAGCPFVLPTGVAHPCVTVQWVLPAARGTVMGDAGLTEESVGLCLAADQAPQGAVLVMFAQPRVEGQ